MPALWICPRCGGKLEYAEDQYWKNMCPEGIRCPKGCYDEEIINENPDALLQELSELY